MIEDDARNAMLLESRYADLVVLSRDADAAPLPGLATSARGLPEYVALHGVRPVLVLPPAWPDLALPGPTVIGWNGSVQAIRALTAALPLLRQAASVTLALINPDTLGNLHGDEPGADMALYLTRHGIKVDVALERTRSGTAEVLMGMARERGASLLVMGAFGHSRAREIVLGGVTRSLLATSPIPLLLAH
jgi:nucleotide-binding universal stress UspA family protein